MDPRDVSHRPRGVTGVVFKVLRSNASTVAVVTVPGIIVSGSEKKLYYIPSDRYKILPAESVIDRKLEVIRDSILNGDFDADTFSRVTMQQAHSTIYGQSPGGNMKCSCKSQNCRNCKCSKGKTACTSACACNGSCKNPFN